MTTTLPPAQLELLDPAELVACLPVGVGAHRVLGAPGTGKTSVLVELAARRVTSGLEPEQLLVLAASRTRADDLRERLSARLRRTIREPAARTVHSLAFGLLRRHALLTGAPLPQLVSAPEQDRMLRELLEGHQAGEGDVIRWPSSCQEALGTSAFRVQLRDLFARATERGCGPDDLQQLGRSTDNAAWVAAGALWREYLDVLELRLPGAKDPAGLVAAAAAVLESGDLVVPWRLVLVDDYQEADPDQERLLRLLATEADIVVAGDPDVTVQTFRGADPQRLLDFPEVFRRPGGRPAATTVLSTCWRRPPALLAAAEPVAQLLPGAGLHRRGQRPDPDKAGTDGDVEVHAFASPSREVAFLATRLRHQHLHEGLPWSAMAVLTRTRGQADELRRLLAGLGVPIRGTAGDVPLAQERVVAALVTAMRVAVRPESLDVPVLAALLAGPLVGVDPVQLRRLVPRLPAPDDPMWWAPTDAAEGRDRSPLVRLRRILSTGRAAAAGSDVTAETLLWAVWDASQVSGRWQQRALRGGTEGARAHRDLDAAMALFALASRAPEGPAGVGELLESVSSAQVRADTLRTTSVGEDAVEVLTVHESAGREWDVVALAGMQEGVWPDLRVRGSLLGADRLVDVIAGRPPLEPPEAVAALRREEVRLLYLGLTRARQSLLVTAVSDDDQAPSVFLDLLDPPVDGLERRCTPVPRQLTLAAVVAELRQAAAGRGEDADAAVRELGRLAALGVRGAAPDSWHGLPPLTTSGRLREPGEEVRVSPSRVEAFLTCPLRWHLETSGGRPVDSTSQTLGTLVHAIAAELPEGGDLPAMMALLDARWEELDLPSNWRSRRVREQAEDMLTKLSEYQRTSSRALVGVEVDVDVVVPAEPHPIRVVGRADRLERDRDGRLVVVDLKTGKHKPALADVPRHPQLGVYQLVVEHGGVDRNTANTAGSGGGVLVHLGANKGLDLQEQEALSDGDDPQWAQHLLETAAAGMGGAEFEASNGPHCRTCPVRRSCPIEGQRAL